MIRIPAAPPGSGGNGISGVIAVDHSTATATVTAFNFIGTGVGVTTGGGTATVSIAAGGGGAHQLLQTLQGQSLGAGATFYFTIGLATANASEAARQTPFVLNGAMSNLGITTNATVPATNSIILTARLNGTATPLTIVLDAGAVAGYYANNTVSVTTTAGALFSLESNNLTATNIGVKGFGISYG